MLKKAGIIVATAAAGLLTLSPLAFAGESGAHHHGSHGSAANDHSPSCSFDASNDNSSRQSGTGFTALLGAAGTVLNTAAPINAQSQAPIASCNNLEDIANVTVKDNFQDNSKTRTDTRTSVRDSGNTTRR